MATDMGLEGEEQGVVSSAVEVLQAEMGPFENYIVGVLTNWPAGLPLERLHNMLRMFVVNPKYDRSLEQLSAFLQVRAGPHCLAQSTPSMIAPWSSSLHSSR